MEGYVTTIGGLLPFATLLIVLLATKRSLLVASAFFMLITAIEALLIWVVFPSVMVGGILKGLLVSFDIALIVMGALFFLDVLKKIRVISSLEHYLHRLVPDSRVQALLLVWLFGGLIEGAAGFGTPAVVVAPLLIHLGFSAVAAASLSLVANTVPVSFGAVGTPIRVGLGGLPQVEVTQFLGNIGFVLALIVPILIVLVLKREIHPRQGVIGPHGLSHGSDDGNSKPSSIVPFALWAGVVFAIPYWLVSRFSTELPALLGSLIGLCVTFALSGFRWWRRLFLPRITQRISTFDPNEVPLHVWRVVTPYVLMVALLILGRMYLPSYTISLPGGISHTLSLFNPGLIMLLLAIYYALCNRLNGPEILHTWKSIGSRMVRMTLVICLLVAAIQMYIHSGNNSSGLESMLHGFTSFLRRENIGIFSAFIGALGGFSAGSTTVSNLMFGQVQWTIAETLGVSTLIVVALQVFGATAGNAISLSNISAIEGALGIKHRARDILARLMLPISLYLCAVILLGAIAAILI